MNVPIYIISLKNDSTRLLPCLDCLGQAGVPESSIHVFAAKTFSDVKPEMLVDNNDDGVRLRLAYGRRIIIRGKMVPNEIACAYSHLSVYLEALAQGYEKVMVMEDDALVPKDFLLRLRACSGLDSRLFDVVNFGCGVGMRSPVEPFRHTIRIGKERFCLKRVGWCTKYLDALFNRRRMIFAAHAYLITARACQKLVDLSSSNLITNEKFASIRIQMPADYLLGYIALNGLRTYCFEPSEYVPVLGKDSHIGERSAHHIVGY